MLFHPFFLLGIDLYSNSQRKEKSYTLNEYCGNIIDSGGKVSSILVFCCNFCKSHGTNGCFSHRNIAETSLRITFCIVSLCQGVVYVIDSGFSKQKFYNPVSPSPFLLFISSSSVFWTFLKYLTFHTLADFRYRKSGGGTNIQSIC